MPTVSVRYIVHDVDEAIGFYCGTLGFHEDMHPAPPFAMLSRGDLRLNLSAPTGQRGGGQAMPDGTRPAPGGWNRFAIEVTDLDALVSDLRAKGARFRNEIVDGVGGRQIIVDDPAGNPVELFEPTRAEARLSGPAGQPAGRTAKEELHASLKNSRKALLAKLDGLSEYDLRRPMTPTGTNLLGLVKHLAGLEYGYLGESFGRPSPEVIKWIEDGSIWQGADMWARADEPSEYITGLYERACAHADQTIEDLSLDAPGSVPHWPPDRRQTTLAALLVRMVAETAQHAGHADIVREMIDGRGGPDQELLSESGWRDYVATVQAAAGTFAAEPAPATPEIGGA